MNERVSTHSLFSNQFERARVRTEVLKGTEDLVVFALLEVKGLRQIWCGVAV